MEPILNYPSSPPEILCLIPQNSMNMEQLNLRALQFEENNPREEKWKQLWRSDGRIRLDFEHHLSAGSQMIIVKLLKTIVVLIFTFCEAKESKMAKSS